MYYFQLIQAEGRINHLEQGRIKLHVGFGIPNV